MRYCNATIGPELAPAAPHFLNPYAILLGLHPDTQPTFFVASGVRIGATD
jgi:hypothetical protein